HDHVGAAGDEAQAVRIAELTVTCTFLSPLAHPLAASVEQRDATVDLAIGDIERAVRSNRDVSRLIEMRRVPLADSGLADAEQQFTVVRELEDLLQRDVGEKDVVRLVDGDAM